MKNIGYGVFCWEGSERRTQRYGNVHLATLPYGRDGETPARIHLDLDALRPLEGKRVRLTCKVVTTRQSAHLGDKALKVFPSTPEEGENITLGVGFLILGEVPAWDETVTTSVGLVPEDDREHFWMDPRVLYRLHDQTVEVFVEETTDPCHPVPDFSPSAEGAILNPDGSVQAVSRGKGFRIMPKVTRLGEGLLDFSYDYKPGERLNAEFED